MRVLSTKLLSVSFQITSELICLNFQGNLGGEVQLKFRISSLQFYENLLYSRCFLGILHNFRSSQGVFFNHKYALSQIPD